MAAINGSNFIIYEEGQAIGHSTNCTLSLNQDLSDASSKDSQGWQDFISGLISAELKISGLTSYDDSLNYRELVDRIITRQKTMYVFQVAGYYYYGFGFVSSVEEITELEGAVSYTVTITVTKELTFSKEITWDILFEYWENINTNWENT